LNPKIPSIAGLAMQSFKKMGVALTIRNLWKFGDIRLGEFKGMDMFGNTYWEGMTWIGPKRWVDYKNYWYDPTEIPAEWHPWLHYTTDVDGKNLQKPIYSHTHRPNITSSDAPYSPQNFLWNRDFGKKPKKLESFTETRSE